MRKLIFALILTSLGACSVSRAQVSGALTGGKELYSAINLAALQRIDALDSLSAAGTFFVSFSLSNGKARELTFSRDAPAQLVSLLKSVIGNTKLEMKGSGSLRFILPVLYDYRGSASLASQLAAIPAIDPDKQIVPDFSDDFDTFSGNADSKGKVVPIHGFFLPWIKLRGKVQ